MCLIKQDVTSTTDKSTTDETQLQCPKRAMLSLAGALVEPEHPPALIHSDSTVVSEVE